MRKTIILAALAILGVFCALLVARPAQAWTIDDANANGFHVVNENDPTAPAGCGHVYVSGHGSPYTDLGHSCDQGFQVALDGYMGQWCPCAQTTAATTTAPPETTAAPTEPPPPPPPATTVVVTATAPTDTTAKAIDDLTARIVALEQKLAALTNRVDRLELAGDASWLAYQQSVANGDPADVAAGLARATWLNAVYGLGAFA